MLKLAGPKAKASIDYSYASVRQAAARALAQGWRSEAQPILRDWVRNHEDAYSRIAVLRTIAESLHDDPTTLSFLQDCATNHPTTQMRSVVLQTIAEGWGGNAQMLAFLQERATNDPGAEVRSAALWAIGRHWRGNAQALAFLQEHL